MDPNSDIPFRASPQTLPPLAHPATPPSATGLGGGGAFGGQVLLSPAQLRRQKSQDSDLAAWPNALTADQPDDAAGPQANQTGNELQDATFLTGLDTEAKLPDAVESPPQLTLADLHASLRKAVQRDIRRTLKNSKALARHLQGTPAVASEDSLKRLSLPRVLAHPDVAVGTGDPIEYAKWKTEKLKAQRMVTERQVQQLKTEQEDAHQRLLQFLEHKQKKKAEEREEKLKKKADDEIYGRQLATFLHAKAEDDVLAYKLKKEAARERARLVKEKVTSGFY